MAITAGLLLILSTFTGCLDNKQQTEDRARILMAQLLLNDADAAYRYHISGQGQVCVDINLDDRYDIIIARSESSDTQESCISIATTDGYRAVVPVTNAEQLEYIEWVDTNTMSGYLFDAELGCFRQDYSAVKASEF